jgi:hypothetical protein
MSEQTPPSGEPTPTPAEGVGPGATEGGTPPPPPPVPPTETSGATPYPPTAPTKKSRKGLIIGIVAAVVVLALIGGVLAAVLATRGPEKHTIAIPSTAGGMKRDKTQEATLKSQLATAEQQFKTQAKNVSYVKSGVFAQDDADRGPKGALVFLGAKLSKAQSPSSFVNAFDKQASANGFKITKVATGDGGGRAVCAAQSTGQKVAICAWATRDTMGELIPTVAGWESKTLAKVMTALRKDVETTE